MLPLQMPLEVVPSFESLCRVYTRSARTFVLSRFWSVIMLQCVPDKILPELEGRIAFVALVSECKILVVSLLVPPVFTLAVVRLENDCRSLQSSVILQFLFANKALIDF